MLPFDPKMLTAKANEILSMDVEGLGEVKFGVITFAERLKLKEIKGDDDIRGITLLHSMLVKAYPDLTLEEMKNQWPDWAISHIADAIEKKLDFREKGQDKEST